jgi:hypothetical protein
MQGVKALRSRPLKQGESVPTVNKTLWCVVHSQHASSVCVVVIYQQHCLNCLPCTLVKEKQHNGDQSVLVIMFGFMVCRDALQDALQLARLLEMHMLAQQQRKQQQQQQPRRHFGTPSAEFGTLVDMPDAWWAAFPHRRRLSRQQEQQQDPDMQLG